MQNTSGTTSPAQADEKLKPALPSERAKRSKGRRWPPEVWAEIGERYIDGETATDLAREFGMTPTAIYHQSAKNGWGKTRWMASVETPPELSEPQRRIITLDDLSPLPPKRRFAMRVHHTPEAKDAAIRAHIELGWTQSKIFEEFGMTPSMLAVEKARRGVTKTKCAKGPPDIDFEPKVEPPAPPWESIAHPAQIAPTGDWATWLFQGGRGAGKTRAGAEWLYACAQANPKGIFALVGATHHDVREVMIDGPAGLMNLPGRTAPKYEASRRRLVFPEGAIAYAFSAEEPQRLRGPQFDGAWADEFCAWRYAKDTLQNLRLSLRRGRDPRLVVTTTPKPMALFRALRVEPTCVVTQAPTVMNARNLAPRFLENIEALYRNTTLSAQELDGLLVEGDAGALWKAATLQQARGARPPAFDRIVVAVDPPVGVSGSACGIVVAGRRGGQAFVLADESVQGLSPLGWARRVCAVARDFGAHEIVAEANQGGDMVRATLASADPPCAITLVHAHVSKVTRATPVSALYEGGRVVHCGAFAALEEEMMALTQGDERSDRVDALVWALDVLMLDHTGGDGPRLRSLNPPS